LKVAKKKKKERERRKKYKKIVFWKKNKSGIWAANLGLRVS
jgi:hypothetical protein